MIQRAMEIKTSKGAINLSQEGVFGRTKSTQLAGAVPNESSKISRDSIKSNLIVINKPIKILVATPVNSPEIGGPATYTQFLKESLPEASKDKIRIITLSWGEVSKWPWLFSHLIYFFKAVNRGRFCDVIYSLDTVNTGWPAWLASVFLKKPFVLKVFGDQAWEQAVRKYDHQTELESFSQISPEYSFQTNWLLKIQTSVATRAKNIIVPCRYLKEMVATWGIDPEKIIVLPETFDELKGIGDKITLRKKMGVQGQIIVAVGDLDKLKNFEALIDMMPAIIAKHPDAKMLIIGEGPQRTALEDKINEMGLEESVMLTGQVEKKLLFTYLKIADVFVSSSLFEGFSYSILEAASLGVPIVATQVGGNRELIEDGVTGSLISLGDQAGFIAAVEKILTDSALAETFSAKAINKVAVFNKEKLIKQFISFIVRVVRD